MPARPIFDQNVPSGSGPATSNLPSSRVRQQDSPLASQLPDWDLVPAHTLLVRRRPGALNTATSRSDAPDKGPMAAPPLPPPVPVAPSASSTPPGVPPPLAAPDRFCQSCGSQLEEGATFCTDCGTKL